MSWQAFDYPTLYRSPTPHPWRVPRASCVATSVGYLLVRNRTGSKVPWPPQDGDSVELGWNMPTTACALERAGSTRIHGVVTISARQTVIKGGFKMVHTMLHEPP